jgi:hypothetical protein
MRIKKQQLPKLSNIETVKDLRNDLIEIYAALRVGQLGLREAKEFANVSGKIMNSAKLQLDYNVHTKSTGKIKFLDCNE